ncbi:MAG: hypothetical protein AABZ39_04205 [Spirochaetota bacterium]
MAKFKRTKYLINRKMQMRIMLNVFITVFVLTSILSLSIYYVVYSRLSQGVSMGKDKIENIDGGEGASAINRVKHMAKATKFLDVTKDNMYVDIIKIFALNVIFSFIVVVVSFLFISHRFAGPAYRFERAFESLSDGDLAGTINLRKNDELQDLSLKFNDMLSVLNGRIASAQKAAHDGDNKAVLDALAQFKTKKS